MKNIFKILPLFLLCMSIFACSKAEEQPKTEELQLDFSGLDLSGMDFNFEEDQHADIPEGADDKVFIAEQLQELKDFVPKGSDEKYDENVKQFDAQISFGKGKYSVTNINFWENNETVTTEFNEENLLATCKTEECVEKTIALLLENYNPEEITTIQILRKIDEPLKIYK